ncbi:MAG: tRNA adenylyltransferase [Pirellulales bacterium]|nr:tRNA adenylyltransferase [Pirellulales bacterium]
MPDPNHAAAVCAFSRLFFSPGTVTMSGKLRQQIAHEAARLMYERDESEYLRAKLKAARRLCGADVRPRDLPSNAEVRGQLQSLTRMLEGEQNSGALRRMRLAALRLMRILANFRPRLIGSVLSGSIRQGSDIDVHLFADALEPVTAALAAAGIAYSIERKRVKKEAGERIFTHLHIVGEYPYELTLYPANQANTVLKSSITGRPIERASIAELTRLLADEYPDACLEQEVLEAEAKIDRFQIFELLLEPLARVPHSPRGQTGDPQAGTALEHALAFFEEVRRARPADTELALVALVADVGLAIDLEDPVAAGLDALEGIMSPRQEWLIRHLPLLRGELREPRELLLARQLETHDAYADLRLLTECERRAGQPRQPPRQLPLALRQLRELYEAA